MDSDPIVDTWWSAISTILSHMASDQEALSDSLSNDTALSLSTLSEELSNIEKRLNGEGQRLIGQVREASSQVDSKTRARDKTKDKVVRAKPSQTSSVMSGIGLNSMDREKQIQKLQQNELAVAEEQEKLDSTMKTFLALMPRVIQDALRSSAKSIFDIRSQVQKASEALSTAGTRQFTLAKDLSSHLLSSISSIPMTPLTDHPDPMSSQERDRRIIVCFLREMEVQLRAKVLPNDQTTSPSTSTSSSSASLDMGSVSTACLAASAPRLFLRDLPAGFQSALSKESCVWFNALGGRIYRDMARSQYFHQWFCSKLSHALNKDKKNRPGFVDDFSVQNVSFGSTPPLLCNVQWQPSSSSSPSSFPGSASEDPSHDPDFDVACTADVTFLSGLSFDISTRLWCNWPMDRLASMPVSLRLQVAEVSGRVRFGVDKRSSFVSFLGEPQTRFEISSQLGDQYKVKDVPKLSEYLVSKLRKFIRKKFVHPGAHRFRLIWPRNWWPAGTENEFLPSGPSDLPVSTPSNTESSTSLSIPPLVPSEEPVPNSCVVSSDPPSSSPSPVPPCISRPDPEEIWKQHLLSAKPVLTSRLPNLKSALKEKERPRRGSWPPTNRADPTLLCLKQATRERATSLSDFSSEALDQYIARSLIAIHLAEMISSADPDSDLPEASRISLSSDPASKTSTFSKLYQAIQRPRDKERKRGGGSEDLTHSEVPLPGTSPETRTTWLMSKITKSSFPSFSTKAAPETIPPSDSIVLNPAPPSFAPLPQSPQGEKKKSTISSVFGRFMSSNEKDKEKDKEKEIPPKTIAKPRLSTTGSTLTLIGRLAKQSEEPSPDSSSSQTQPLSISTPSTPPSTSLLTQSSLEDPIKPVPRELESRLRVKVFPSDIALPQPLSDLLSSSLESSVMEDSDMMVRVSGLRLDLSLLNRLGNVDCLFASFSLENCQASILDPPSPRVDSFHWLLIHSQDSNCLPPLLLGSPSLELIEEWRQIISL